MSSWNPNIPLVTDKILQSARQIKANFRAINQSFNANHVPLTSSDDLSGKHNALIFTVASDPTTTANETALYTKLVSSVPQLFFRPNSDQTPIQMTYPSLQTGLQSTDPDVYYTSQYSFVAGPFVIYMGYVHLSTDGQAVVLSPITTLRHVDLTVTGAGPGFNLASPINVAANSFTIKFPTLNSSVRRSIFYLAVGS